MRRKYSSALCLAFGLLLLALPAAAHHAVVAEFDTTKVFSVKGTISKLEWVNPHVYIYVDVKQDDGTVATYSFGNPSPGYLRRCGVTKATFNVGDQVTIDAFAPKDGSKNLGFLKQVHFADGRTIVMSANGQSD